MKKTLGVLIMILGIIIILISIMGLVKAFDIFSNISNSIENMGYTFGSIVVPLLLTVTGRWLYRKGKIISRN